MPNTDPMTLRKGHDAAHTAPKTQMPASVNPAEDFAVIATGQSPRHFAETLFF